MNIFLATMAAFTLITKALDPSPFGPHDPDTQAAFAEMAQNHTGTKTEERYRKEGLDKILDECRKHPKQARKSSFETEEEFTQYMERMHGYSQEDRAKLPQEEQDACNHLQKIFEQTRQEYKGILSDSVNKNLIILDLDYGPEVGTHFVTLFDNTLIFFNPKSTVFLNYCTIFKNYLSAKNTPEKNVAESLLKKQETEIKALLFHELFHWKKGEEFNYYMEKIHAYSQEHKAALPQEEHDACNRLQELFEKTCQEYKGTPSHVVNKNLIIENFNCKQGNYAYTISASGNTLVFFNPKSNVFLNYCTLVKNYLATKNTPENTAAESLLKKQEREIQAFLFHELSHRYTCTLCKHLSKHAVDKSHETPCIEEYCNTLAVLNSPHPLRTARNLKNGYHSAHIPALAKALREEGVKE